MFLKGTTAGAGSVPPGLQEGMEGMKVGSRRKVLGNFFYPSFTFLNIVNVSNVFNYDTSKVTV
jgi:FKBP-type peptidyl-prolyl cis-trans isomerase